MRGWFFEYDNQNVWGVTTSNKNEFPIQKSWSQ